MVPFPQSRDSTAKRLVEDLEATVVFEPEYRNPDALRGLEGFSHLWLIWSFSQAIRPHWSPTVRPPRLGGNTRMGVFATRSPFRPNPIGLSSVRLKGIVQHPTLGPVLHVAGADLMDGTPIFDIKPYLPYTDAHPQASSGFTADYEGYHLTVRFPEDLLKKVPPEKQARPCGACWPKTPVLPTRKTPHGSMAWAFGGLEVKFSVQDGVLTVLSVEKP